MGNNKGKKTRIKEKVNASTLESIQKRRERKEKYEIRTPLEEGSKPNERHLPIRCTIVENGRPLGRTCKGGNENSRCLYDEFKKGFFKNGVEKCEFNPCEVGIRRSKES